MRCPGCDSTLSSLQYEGITVETCGTCSGCWLDADELGRIVRIREKRFSPQQWSSIDSLAKIPGIPVEEIERDIVCPSCDTSTGPINYGGDTGMIIDRCPKCRGIWLDVGELESIQMLVESWKDSLPDDLHRFGPLLDRVADDLKTGNQVAVSNLPAGFINAVINGILDVGL